MFKNYFSIPLLIILILFIFLGLTLTHFDLPGLPFSIPFSGFLSAHLLFRLFNQKTNVVSLIFSFLTLLIIAFVFFFQIKITKFLNYNALLIFFVSLIIFTLFEFLHSYTKKKSN